MIREVDPLALGLAGFACLGIGLSFANPNTRALISQRNTATQLQQAVQVEIRATEAAKAIAAARANCTRVARVDPAATYHLPPGTAICDGRISAIIGTDRRPTLLAQEVQP
jgi:hypothetical protein